MSKKKHYVDILIQLRLEDIKVRRQSKMYVKIRPSAKLYKRPSKPPTSE